MKILFIIGAGGFLGSVARYLAAHNIQKGFLSTFPLGTMTVNIVGCLIIGIIYALSEKGNVSPEWRLFLATGFCGGFTTFSSFSYESLSLLRENELLYFALYVSLSVFIGLLASYAGTVLVKLI